jgi:preprotein translocase subunit YajC
MLGLLLYMVVLGPQRRLKKQRADLMNALGEGDEIVTIGGMHGRVVELGDVTVDVEVSEGVIVRYDRRAIRSITRRSDDPLDDVVEEDDVDEDDEVPETDPVQPEPAT